MNIETLQKFCWKLWKRESIENPWTNGDYTYATDGRILVRVDNNPSASVYEKGKTGIDVSSFSFDHDKLGPACWMTIPEVEVPVKNCAACNGSGKVSTCPECDGEGEIDCECDECGHEHQRECPQCRGEGVVAGGEMVVCKKCHGFGKEEDSAAIGYPVGCAIVSKLYLKLIRDNSENAKIEISEKGHGYDPLRFKFYGGLGYLMPMRKPQ